MTDAYKVAVLQEILRSEDESIGPVIFFKELDLPFAPSVGLEINLVGEWFCGPLQRVIWHGDDAFLCWVEADDSLVNEDIPEFERLSENMLYDFLKGRGWTRLASPETQPSFF